MQQKTTASAIPEAKQKQREKERVKEAKRRLKRNISEEAREKEREKQKPRIQGSEGSHPTLDSQILQIRRYPNHCHLLGYNAGWFGTGLGSHVFNRDTNVPLDLTSWGNRPRLQNGFVRYRVFYASL